MHDFGGQLIPSEPRSNVIHIININVLEVSSSATITHHVDNHPASIETSLAGNQGIAGPQSKLRERSPMQVLAHLEPS